MRNIITDLGEFRRDSSYIWHYQCGKGGALIYDAAFDCIDNIYLLPECAVIFFWHNGECAPVKRGDTSTDLYKRWEKWSEGNVEELLYETSKEHIP